MEVSALSTPQILFGSVMHKRLFPKVNAFQYGIYYLSLPLSKINADLENVYLKYNRFGFLSFYDRDHGDRDGSNLRDWAMKTLSSQGVNNVDGEIILVTMPRVLGYVFNPVSFWYCYDRGENLRAVICEVNNTFGQTHTYVCPYEGDQKSQDQITATDKAFHVSPFLTRDGGYRFRFAKTDKNMGAWIDYYHKDGEKQLITFLKGDLKDLTNDSLARAFWRYPLVTLKAIVLIHWQALKLLAKGIEYVPKPVQKTPKITKAEIIQEEA